MILVNGAAGAPLPATDRGLAYGDGVFRTFAIRNGLAQHWPRHYDKLRRDCTALDLVCPESAVFERDIAALSTAVSDCAVKVMVTRGSGERGYRVPIDAVPTRIVISSPLPRYPAEYQRDGVRVRRCSLKLSRQPALAGVKHLNRLENVLARSEWNDPAIAEGLLCDSEGKLIGGTMSNVFIVERGMLVTPDLSGCGIEGVTRDRVIDAAAASGIGCRVEPVDWVRLRAADEVFLVNSLIGLWRVREIDGEECAAGPVATGLRALLDGPAHANC